MRPTATSERASDAAAHIPTSRRKPYLGTVRPAVRGGGGAGAYFVIPPRGREEVSPRLPGGQPPDPLFPCMKETLC